MSVQGSLRPARDSRSFSEAGRVHQEQRHGGLLVKPENSLWATPSICLWNPGTLKTPVWEPLIWPNHFALQNETDYLASIQNTEPSMYILSFQPPTRPRKQVPSSTPFPCFSAKSMLQSQEGYESGFEPRLSDSRAHVLSHKVPGGPYAKGSQLGGGGGSWVPAGHGPHAWICCRRVRLMPRKGQRVKGEGAVSELTMAPSIPSSSGQRPSDF